MNKKEDSVQALAVGASVERKSGESEQVAFESESEQIAATKNDIGASKNETIHLSNKWKT